VSLTGQTDGRTDGRTGWLTGWLSEHQQTLLLSRVIFVVVCVDFVLLNVFRYTAAFVLLNRK